MAVSKANRHGVSSAVHEMRKRQEAEDTAERYHIALEAIRDEGFFDDRCRCPDLADRALKGKMQTRDVTVSMLQAELDDIKAEREFFVKQLDFDSNTIDLLRKEVKGFKQIIREMKKQEPKFLKAIKKIAAFRFLGACDCSTLATMALEGTDHLYRERVVRRKINT